MFTKLLIKLIKKNKNMEALLKEEDVREVFLSNLTHRERVAVLETIDYSDLIINTNLQNKNINLSNSILVNVKITDCKIQGGLTENLLYKSSIVNNTCLPAKNNKEKIELIPIK